ncbi:MAG: alcohol dehydrogenase catalytic domain-containing protein [Bacteroidales bacterium]
MEMFTGNMVAAMMEEPMAPLVVRNMPVPVPGKGEVLIKMEAAALNPSDLSMLTGGYAVKPRYPFIPGIEGSGTVVGHGGGLLARLRMGRRVACTSSPGGGGTWAGYMVTSAAKTIPLPTETTFEEGASLIVNPMTVVAFLRILKGGRYRAAVNTAAASALGKMLIRLLKREKLPLINIVRRTNQVATLEEAGAEYILVSSSPGFEEKFASLAERLEADIILDAVGGSLAGTLISKAPPGTRFISYASLSGDNISIDPKELLQQNKSAGGFYLATWLASQSLTSTLSDISKVKRMISSELATEVSASMPLSDINKAVTEYRKQMTRGKIIIKP